MTVYLNGVRQDPVARQDQPADSDQEVLLGQEEEDIDPTTAVGLPEGVLVVGMRRDAGYAHSVLNMQKA